MKHEEDLLLGLGQGSGLTPERVANLLIPLMGAIYAKQQLQQSAGTPITLSEAFRAVVRDIFSLSNEVAALEKEIEQRKLADDDMIN